MPLSQATVSATKNLTGVAYSLSLSESIQPPPPVESGKSSDNAVSSNPTANYLCDSIKPTVIPGVVTNTAAPNVQARAQAPAKKSSPKNCAD